MPSAAEVAQRLEILLGIRLSGSHVSDSGKAAERTDHLSLGDEAEKDHADSKGTHVGRHSTLPTTKPVAENEAWPLGQEARGPGQSSSAPTVCLLYACGHSGFLA